MIEHVKTFCALYFRRQISCECCHGGTEKNLSRDSLAERRTWISLHRNTAADPKPEGGKLLPSVTIRCSRSKKDIVIITGTIGAYDCRDCQAVSVSHPTLPRSDSQKQHLADFHTTILLSITLIPRSNPPTTSTTNSRSNAQNAPHRLHFSLPDSRAPRTHPPPTGQPRPQDLETTLHHPKSQQHIPIPHNNLPGSTTLHAP